MVRAQNDTKSWVREAVKTEFYFEEITLPKYFYLLFFVQINFTKFIEANDQNLWSFGLRLLSHPFHGKFDLYRSIWRNIFAPRGWKICFHEIFYHCQINRFHKNPFIGLCSSPIAKFGFFFRCVFTTFGGFHTKKKFINCSSYFWCARANAL